jgi:hypothetical protein
MIEFENKIHSQNGEDGIIKFIFDKIGTTNKIAVEFGVSAGGSGLETNTLQLSKDEWKLYWYDILPITHVPQNCIFEQVKLTVENIVSTFNASKIPKEFDLLSIDIDGNDYYIREALLEFSPRVCIMEYNGSYDGVTEYIMPRNDEYIWTKKDTRFGASLKSLTMQADRLGYDLVYCESKGVNCFFVRKDINPFEKQSSEYAWKKLWWAK